MYLDNYFWCKNDEENFVAVRMVAFNQKQFTLMTFNLSVKKR
jgi:hypothetical protein